MADSMITQLDAVTEVESTDLLVVVSDADSGSPATSKITVENLAASLRAVGGYGGELTIDSGLINIPSLLHNFYTIDTESDSASDNLTNITPPAGVYNGFIIRVMPAVGARTVVLKHGANGDAGYLSVGSDRSLDNSSDIATLVYVSTQAGYERWVLSSFADNGS